MSANLKERLLQTASELFYSQGIKATGVDAIVKAAGTTKMSLYKYYPSKDDLILAYLQRQGNKLRTLISQDINHRTDEPEEKLLAVFDVFVELSSSPKFRGCPFINASAEYVDTDGPISQASAEFYREFANLLTELAGQAGLRHPKDLAAQLVLLIAGAIVNEQIYRNCSALAMAKQAATVLIAHSRGGN